MGAGPSCRLPCCDCVASERELGKLFASLNVHLLPKEVAKAMAEMDDGNDKQINAKELLQWLM